MCMSIEGAVLGGIFGLHVIDQRASASLESIFVHYKWNFLTIVSSPIILGVILGFKTGKHMYPCMHTQLQTCVRVHCTISGWDI